MDVNERLRAACPPVPDAEPDRELLAQVMDQPVARRRRPRVALPAAAVAALAAAAVVLLGGNGPDTASALAQAMHWFDPPAGTVLHSVMVDQSGQTHEFWQDIDHPEQSRTIELGGAYEYGAGGIYERASNTIYMDDGARTAGKGPDPAADALKRAKLAGDSKRPAEAEPGKSSDRVKVPETLPKGDPTVAKVRVLIDLGRASVQGSEEHNGVQAWKIALTDTADRAPWVLWVRADDGKPLAIDDPGDPARNRAGEHSRWTTYEVLDSGTVSLRAAHPGARVVHDGAQYDALLRRMRR
jgi:hypothetical protein